MKRLLKLCLIFSILTSAWACEKDEEENEIPQGVIAAIVNLRDANGVISSNPWSLPSISATRRNGNITLTAYNAGSGEIFTLRVPDDGAAYYSNTSADNDPGYGSWRRNANSLTWYSNDLPEGTPGNFAVDLTEVNEVNNTISGTFFMPVFSPLDEMNAFFQNGSFSNVPIVISEESDAITENRVSLRVNGINFNPVLIEVEHNENVPELIVTTTNATDGTLIFALPLAAVNSTEYPVGSNEGEISISLQQPPFDPSIGISGNLIVEFHNQGARTMSGTFEFEAGQFDVANQSVTDGVFEVIY